MCRVSSFQPKTFILPTPLITKVTIPTPLPVSSSLPPPQSSSSSKTTSSDTSSLSIDDGVVENKPRKKDVIIDDVTFVYDPARPGSKKELNGVNTTSHDDVGHLPIMLPSSPDRIYQIGNVEPFHKPSLARIFRYGDSNVRDDNTCEDDTATMSISLQLLSPPASPDSPFLLPFRDTYNSKYSNKDEKVDRYDHNDIGLTTRQQQEQIRVLSPSPSSPFVYETPPSSPKRKLSLIETLEPPPTPCCKRTIVDFYQDDTNIKCNKDQGTRMMLLQHSHDHQQRNIFLPFIL